MARRGTLVGIAEEAATLVVNQVELIGMIIQVIEDTLAVLALALLEPIWCTRRFSGGQQAASDSRSIASGDGRAGVQHAHHLALDREQHLLGATPRSRSRSRAGVVET